MRNDHQLQNAVLEHLDCNPCINSSHIGVVARDGVVTLTGHVPSFGEKRAAEVAAGQVKGAKAIVDQIVVELPGCCQTTDEQLAERAYARLASNVAVPIERIQISVEEGAVTLRGDVEWRYQRQATVDDLQQLGCVREVRNEIVIKPPGQTRTGARQDLRGLVAYRAHRRRQRRDQGGGEPRDSIWYSQIRGTKGVSPRAPPGRYRG